MTKRKYENYNLLLDRLTICGFVHTSDMPNLFQKAYERRRKKKLAPSRMCYFKDALDLVRYQVLIII
jgi:hypothetical protein